MSINLYLSFDIEADGPSPYMNNMLSLGICGLLVDGTEKYSYIQNIKPLPNHVSNTDTMTEFWAKNTELWNSVNENQIDCISAMSKLATELFMLKHNGYNIIWVAMPSAYDWQWLNYYWQYALENGAIYPANIKLGFKASCISSSWQIYCDTRNMSKSESNQLWDKYYGVNPNKHNAYYDAKHQCLVYIGLLNEIKNNNSGCK